MTDRGITAKRLQDLHACSRQIETFRSIWGDGPAPMTIEAAVENAEKFVWDWAAEKLLSPGALVEYSRATAPALAEYDRAEAAAWAEFYRDTDAALDKRDRAIAAAWAEYKRATAPARAEYKRAKARAFAEAYRRQETGE